MENNDLKQNRTSADAGNEIGVGYKLPEKSISIATPDGVAYREDLLSWLDQFMAEQKAKPKNQVVLSMAFDLDSIEPEEEAMADDDPRLGINAFDVRNVVFSKYNDWKPLFEEKVDSGVPQIFIVIDDWWTDLAKVAETARNCGVAYAVEKGVDKYDKAYSRLILSFGDDCKAASDFICLVATNLLLVPKDIVASFYIQSSDSKSKAQKEYKKNNTFSAGDIAKGLASLWLKPRRKG